MSLLCLMPHFRACGYERSYQRGYAQPYIE